MAEKSTPKPKVGTDRDARLKAALKANLGRRKAQAKARRDVDQEADKTDKNIVEQDDG